MIPSFTRSAPPPDPFNGTVVILAPGSTVTPQSDEYRTRAGMDDLLKAVYHADTDMTAGNTTWNEAFATENVFDSPNPGLVKIGRNMVAGKSGIETVWFDDREAYIAYAPVTSMK
ncbi:MAG: hypothetical protein WC620_09995 [Methanoregula sp.]